MNRKNRWLEALLCGILALTINGFLEGVGLSSSLASFAGGMVGIIGEDKLHKIAIKFLNTKTTCRGDNNYDDKNSPDIHYNLSTVLNKVQVNLSLSTNLIYGELS